MPTKEATDIQLTSTELPRELRGRAVRVIASAAGDAGDCATLLDMLGLNAEEGFPTVPGPRA